MLINFAKSEARIDDYPTNVYTCLSASDDTLREEIGNLAGNILITRVSLHRSRLTLHVHKANSTAGRRGRLQGAVTLQGKHIVNHCCAGSGCSGHN